MKEQTVVIIALIVAASCLIIGYRWGLNYLPPKLPTCQPFTKVFYDKAHPEFYYDLTRPNPDQVFITCY